MLIYKVTNTVNGKIYVGCTSGSLERRWIGHVDCAKYKKRCASPLHADIIEYGVRNFAIEVLQTCSKRKAEETETHWIERLNSRHPNGYNIRSGGCHSPMAESSKKKMRGRIFTPEHRENISKAMTGRKNPDARRTIEIARLHRFKNGTPSGENNPRALLTVDKVQEIRRRYKAGGVSQETLGKEYGLKQVTVSAIIRRRNWKNVPD